MYTQQISAPSRPGLLARLLAALIRLEAQARARRRLATLDAHMLRDIGMTEAEVQTLEARPEWDAPAHWRR